MKFYGNKSRKKSRFISPTGRRRLRRNTYTRRNTKKAYATGRAKYPTSQFRIIKAINSYTKTKVLTTNISQLISTAGCTISIPTIAYGTNPTNRLSQKIFIRYVWLKGTIAAPRGVPADNFFVGNIFRHLGIWPKTQNLATSSIVVTTIDLPNRDLYTILWDKTRSLGSSSKYYGFNTGTAGVIPFNVKIKIMKTYTYNNNAVALPIQALPFFYFVSDIPSNIDDLAKIALTCSCNVSFKDIA